MTAVDRLAAALTHPANTTLINDLVSALTPADVRADVDRLLHCVEALEHLGLNEHAARTLALVLDALRDSPRQSIEVRNRRALLAVSRGTDALDLFEDLLIDAGRAHPAMLDVLRANLAAANLLAGNLQAATKWADVAARSAGVNPAVDSLVASVRASIAGLRLDRAEFAQAAEVQRRALETGLATANQNDPATLAAFTSVVSTQFQLAMSQGARQRAEAAIDLMEIALQRTAATLGREHPRTLVVLANHSTAQFELACADGDADAVRRALTRVRHVSDLSAAVLGPAHPQALVALSNLGAAMFEIARVAKSPAQARHAVAELRIIAAHARDTLGADHPQAVTVLANLASAEFDVARVDGSRESAERALASLNAASARSAAVLGADHPATLVLEQELHLCEGWMTDDEDDGDGTLLTKRRTATRKAFDEQYLSIGAAAEVLAGHELQVGDIVVGTVLQTTPTILVDLGGSVPGLVPEREFGQEPPRVGVGDLVEVLVTKTRPTPIVSFRRVVQQRPWNELARAGLVRGRVVEVVDDGLVLDVGVPAFLPAAQIELRRVGDLHQYLGRVLEALVTEVDEDRQRFVVSRRALLERRRETALRELEPGQAFEGVVTSVLSYGAYVDLGSIEGFVHIGELAPHRFGHAEEVVRVGQHVAVRVVDVDLKSGQVTLSMRDVQG